MDLLDLCKWTFFVGLGLAAAGGIGWIAVIAAALRRLH